MTRFQTRCLQITLHVPDTLFLTTQPSETESHAKYPISHIDYEQEKLYGGLILCKNLKWVSIKIEPLWISSEQTVAETV